MAIRFFIAIYFFPTLLFGQGTAEFKSDRLEIYLEKYLETNGANNEAAVDFLSVLDKLEVKRGIQKNDIEFLRFVFNKLHKKFLKHYNDYVPFSELFYSGTYNCLTATTLYALVLDHFGYNYKVVETNYHIFLLVKTSDRDILLETTDPQSGFVDRETMIEEKIKQYRENKIEETSSNKTYYHFQFDLYNQVDLNELIGLLYYNQSVAAFNRNRMDEAVNALDKAASYYKSQRIEEFSRVILLTLIQSNLESSTKQLYVDKVKSLRRHNIL
ncbi:MAG TPA: hypothetical protein VFW11_14305 [Cyclobacteriaceae bacterium]|nr:hypothetical protein [Cyclobacteriaceae bacterium]